ncbi:CocE/NonD family hydrolase [Actinomadura madurae]|uniref:CocE/NonD family hydrolase n=1 Tax=Actinomadura madurae TaxID=1993 RepID=UPI0020D202AD|nr:CocE/NonD family hydrolase [Actinomadura madurae]MCQ0003890.1 CocE/NonD family hydrolase [Actinomadura madurae]MCQ0020755.1 CocE/NonD family hydrolase [Actinomadura madurae]
MGLCIDANVAVPMRDGVTLATDLWRPAGDGPWPVLLARTPYGRTSTAHLGNPKLPDIRALVDSGYLAVVQDVRGTGESPGLMEPHRFDQSDTVDTLAWIAGQAWCDGNVGMWGASYMGFPQWQAATEAPPVLRAIAPAMTSADIYRAWYSPQGAVSQGTLFNWSARMAVANLSRPRGDGPPDPRDAATVRAALEDVDALYSMPVDGALLRGLPWLGEMLANPDYDTYWKRLAALERTSAIVVPALNVTGWYDVFAREVVRSYTTMRRNGGSVPAREGQRLIIGPWGHGDGADLGIFPDRSFGLAGSVKAAAITQAHLRFFDRWLKGCAEADQGARVRVFVMGLDRWRDEDDWPLPDTRYEEYFLHSSGRANGSKGDGRLHRRPAADDRNDSYSYDPLDPVPTVGGATLGFDGVAGPADQTDVERRDDVLCYTGESLQEPLEVTGHVTLTVHVSSTAADTDVTGKLVDVFPDGRAIILCEGLWRMRYRDSLSRPRPLEPGQIVEATVDMGVTSNVFGPGHRIRLEVSSSNFPRYDRNTNGGDPAMSTTRVALNRVFHGPAHPSRLTLPVIARPR